MADSVITIDSKFIKWARRRSGRDQEYFARHFPDIDQWEEAGAHLTFEQLANFAEKTHTPIGNFFLESPPEVDLGILDFRTMGDARISQPSADLVDTIALVQERQEWYRTFVQSHGYEPVTFVGSINVTDTISHVAEAIRTLLDFELGQRRQLGTLDEVYRILAAKIEALGILVMKNGVVGNNTHRPLDPYEFRGFALADPLASIIFVNGHDTVAASIFTLIHELVHIGIGQSAITNSPPPDAGGNIASFPSRERWCNQVAAEVLVPQQELRREFSKALSTAEELHRLSRLFKASKFVVVQSLFDANLIGWDEFSEARSALSDAWGRSGPALSSGGNGLNNATVRIGRTFGRAVISETLSGNTLYTDAYRLLSTKTHGAFLNLASHLGVS